MGQVASNGRRRRSASEAGKPARLRLTTEFELRLDGRPIALPHNLQRVLAYLALAHHPVDRSTVAGALWLDVPQRQANGSLRSALWRLGNLRGPVIRSTNEWLAIESNVEVDVDELAEMCMRMIAGDDRDALSGLSQLLAGPEILPTWDEEWLILEQERYRQLRLHALERAGETLLAQGEYGRAIDVGLAVLEYEPLRESAHRLVVQVHLREGNLTEAIRQYRQYERLLRDELGIVPSPRMETIMSAGLWGHAGAPDRTPESSSRRAASRPCWRRRD